MARGWTEGDRVGVMLGGNAETKVVRFLGYGEYIGETVPPEHVGGFNFGIPNPTLKLDSGKLCYGCETYWDWETEAAMKDRIAKWEAEGWTVAMVDIDDARAEARTE